MPTLRFGIVAGFVLALVLSACASSGNTGPRRSINLITVDELEERNYANALEAIQRLRPQWLQARGSVSARGGPNLPVVFLDEARYGSVDQLRNIQLHDVASIRFVNAADATTRHGTGYPGGVIEVFTRRH